MKRIVVSGAVICSLFLMLVPTAGAGDGVLEINQACAANTGCFTGDSAGFPVRIAAGGSYRLTSNLVLPELAYGIEITGRNVVIDLNGFEIRGPTCPPEPVVDPINQVGIYIDELRPFNTVVKNGNVSCMAGSGLFINTEGAQVTNVGVSQNAYVGISANYGAIVSGNTVHGNYKTGIFSDDGSIISGNVVYENGTGIAAGLGSKVSNNTVRKNGSTGIFCSECLIVGNIVSENDGAGLKGNSFTYRDNTIYFNTGGAVDSPSALNAGGNTCNTSLTCP